MTKEGFKPFFENSRLQQRMDFSFFRLDPSFYFLSPGSDKSYEPDVEAISIACGQDPHLFLKYLNIEKPNLGYGSHPFYPLDKVDCRHVMMSILSFGKVKNARTVLEIGGGWGNWCRLNMTAHPIDHWSIVDLDFVLELQKWYLKQTLSQNQFNKISFIDAEKENFQGNFDIAICAHSLSELSMDDFNKYLPVLNRCKYIFYAFHRHYPTINMSLEKEDILMKNFSIMQLTHSEDELVHNLLLKNKIYYSD